MQTMGCGCRGKCQCGKVKEIVYPTREEVKNTYSEETVKHIYPSHTTVVNNHTIRNEYYYPHTTSYEERVREVEVRGAQDRPGTNGDVGGVMDHDHHHHHHHHGGGRPCGCGWGPCRCRRRGWW